MGDKFSKSNINNVSGDVFNGTTNIIAGNNSNFEEHEIEKSAIYTPEPVWRSPITMALLTWIGFFISLIGIFPLYKTFEPVINLFTNKSIKMNPNNSIYSVILVVIMLVLIIIIWLRSINSLPSRRRILLFFPIVFQSYRVQSVF